MKIPDPIQTLIFLSTPKPVEGNSSVSGDVAHDHVQAMDAAAWTMIGLLFFLLACVLFAVWRIHQHSRKCSPLDGLDIDDSKPKKAAPDKPTEWEKDPGWWKK